MFICGSCKTLTKPGTPQVKVVLKTRARTYDFHDDGLCNEASHKTCHHGPIVHKSHGTEIVQEIGVCPNCLPEPEGHA